MALRLQSMENVTPPGGSYPYGNVKDDDGSGNGTPVNRADFADMFQFFARLLALGSVVGNDLPENSANTFQYHTALQNIINNSVVGFLQLKGGIDCSTNPNYPAASKGWSYVVTVAGKIGGASGITVAIGDYIIASADNAGGTQGAVGSSWFIVERNLDQATETTPGIAEIATQAETNTGTDDLRFVTPLKLETKIPPASETAAGRAELATQAETNTGTDDARIVTPLKLATYSRWALKANKAQAAWIAIPLASVNWSTNPGGYHAAEYMIDEFGKMNLRGVLDCSGSPLTALFSSGWMTSAVKTKIGVVMISSGGVVSGNVLDIATDGTGTLGVSVPVGSTISLDGISFWIS